MLTSAYIGTFLLRKAYILKNRIRGINKLCVKSHT